MTEPRIILNFDGELSEEAAAELRRRFEEAVARNRPTVLSVRPSRDLSTVLWRRGRLSLLFEPRDIWLGVFIGPGAVYVCLVPCVAVRWAR